MILPVIFQWDLFIAKKKAFDSVLKFRDPDVSFIVFFQECVSPFVLGDSLQCYA